MSQSQLAERADLSIDTIKSVENGRRAMSLDTYLKIVQALETTPYALMNWKHPEEYIDRFAFMMTSRNEREIELALAYGGAASKRAGQLHERVGCPA
jgi:transcriptional regulator with XRE-family HTH domain